MEEILSKKLKTFFSTIKDIYGDDMAFAMAIEKDDIIESLNMYSNFRFNGYSTGDIYKELIKNELVSDNVMLPFTKQFIETGKVNEIFNFIDSNDNYKATLIRSYINNSHKHISYDSVKEYIDIIDEYTPEHVYGRVLTLTSKVV